jgi:hypothetical protein
MQPVDFCLNYDQYLYIQHYLPKRYALIEHRHIRKGQVVTSNVKLAQEDVKLLIIFRFKIYQGFLGIKIILMIFKEEQKE